MTPQRRNENPNNERVTSAVRGATVAVFGVVDGFCTDLSCGAIQEAEDCPLAGHSSFPFTLGSMPSPRLPTS